MQIFWATYCKSFDTNDPCTSEVCQDFVKKVKEYMPSLLQKPKLHLLLHLSTNMDDFGPMSVFNTERYCKQL